MIDFLLGVPGKLKAIYSHLTTNLSSTRSARLDFLTGNVATASSLATLQSTSLSNATWTDTRATALDKINAQGSLISANFGQHSDSFYIDTSWKTLLSVSGVGSIMGNLTLSDAVTYPRELFLRLTVDGVVLIDISGTNTYLNAIPGGWTIPFFSSVLVEAKVGSNPANCTFGYSMMRTA